MEKLRLLEITFDKMSQDSAYIAFYLSQVMVSENKTRADLIKLLDCNEENYYKLGLCKSPEINDPEFKTRIEKIASYAGVPGIVLSNIILSTAPQGQAAETTQPSVLEESWLILKRLVPAWIYRPALSLSIIILIVLPLLTQGKETQAMASYIDSYQRYSDSVKHVYLRDNTYVAQAQL